jgi:hypothetical protein
MERSAISMELSAALNKKLNFLGAVSGFTLYLLLLKKAKGCRFNPG